MLRPQLAHELEDTGRIEVVDRDIGSAPGNAARIASDVRIAAYLLAALTLAAAIAALVITPDRRRTASQLGVALIAVGMLIVVAYTIARAIALGQFDDPDDRAAAAAVWAAFLGDLRTFGWVLAGSGAVVAAAAASLVRPVAIEGTLLRAWRIATTEPATTWRTGRARRGADRRRGARHRPAADGGPGRRDARRASTSPTRASRRSCG